MAIGDYLLGSSQQIGPIPLSKELAGQVSVSGSTSQMFNGVTSRSLASVAGQMRMEGQAGGVPIRAAPLGPQDPATGQTLYGGPGQAVDQANFERQRRMEPRPSLSEAILKAREPNPYTGEPLRPEDDALTPEGQPSPTELQQAGSFLSGVAKVLSSPYRGLVNLREYLDTPDRQKTLSAIGAAIGGKGSVAEAIAGQTIGKIDAEAERQFRGSLERSGGQFTDIPIPGLTAEGRSAVLQDFNRQKAVSLQERNVAVNEAQEQRQQDLHNPEAFKQETTVRLQRLQQDVELGSRDLEESDLRIKALRRADELAETADVNTIVREAAQAAGVKIPDGADLTGLTIEQGLDLIDHVATLRNIMANKSDNQVLAEGMRMTIAKSLGRHLVTLQDQLEAAGGKGNTAWILRQIGEATRDILSAGGDPVEIEKIIRGEQQGGGQEAGGEEAQLLKWAKSQGFPADRQAIVKYGRDGAGFSLTRRSDDELYRMGIEKLRKLREGGK